MRQRPKAPDAAAIVEIRKRVYADPNTLRIAKAMGLTLEAYAEEVMKYVINPNREPVMNIIADSDLKAMGYEPPDLKKVAAKLQEHADALTMTTKSKFADPNSQREKVTGKIPQTPAAKVEPDEVRKDLKEELDRELSTGKGKKF